MLTTAQTMLHWRRWSAVADANDWTMSKGRLTANAQRTRDLSIYHKLIWRAAEQLALQNHRSITADDLRHACYVVATTAVPGRDRPPGGPRACSSMTDLSNREFSRVLVLWDLLIEPDDIDATIKWDHPEVSERESYLRTIPKLAPDATVRAIAANAFGTRLWENCDAGQLRWLQRTLREKQKRWGERPREPKPANCPF